MSDRDFFARQSTDEALVAFASEEITVSTTAVGLTENTYAPDNASGRPWQTDARRAFITIAGAAMRYLMDGTTATTDLGHVLADGGSLTVNGIDNIRNFSAIRDAATDVEMTVTYSR